jgi:hypothetical protein
MMREWVATGRWAAGLRGWTGAVMLGVLALLPFSPAQAAGKKHTTATSHRTAAKAHSAKATAPRKSESKASSRSPRVSAKLDGRRHGKARVASKTHRLSLRPTVAREEPPARLSFGQMAGLHEVTGPLGLKSSVALVVDQDTHQVLLGKNEHAVLPIASLTKLMTGMVFRGPPADGRGHHHHGRGRRHREEQPLAPDRGHRADARRAAAPGADVQREPRRPCAGAHLSGRAEPLRVADERAPSSWA